MTMTHPHEGLQERALKPCPWCAGRAVMRRDDDPGYPWYVTFDHADSCPMYAVPTDLFRSFSTEAEAVIAWTPHATCPAVQDQGLCDALERIAGKNDLSGVPDDEVEAAARNALYECELIARAALSALPQQAAADDGEGLDDQVNAIINRNAEYMNGLDGGQRFFRTAAVIAMVREALSTPTSQPPAAETRLNDEGELRCRIQGALLATLGDTYDCTRVWEAWNIGTMDRDDFVPVLDRLEELVDEIATALTQPEPTAPQGSEEEQAAWDGLPLIDRLRYSARGSSAPYRDCALMEEAANALSSQQAAGEAVEVEPVAWMYETLDGGVVRFYKTRCRHPLAPGRTETPLYATPQPTETQCPTDETMAAMRGAENALSLLLQYEQIVISALTSDVEAGSAAIRAFQKAVAARHNLLAPIHAPRAQPTETQRIVAWLMRHFDGELSANQHVQRAAKAFADAIARGEHLAGEGDKA